MEGLLVKGGDEAGRGGGAVGIVASLRVEGDSGSSICSTERGQSKAQLATTYIIYIIVLSGVHLGRSNAIRGLGMVGVVDGGRPNKVKERPVKLAWRPLNQPATEIDQLQLTFFVFQNESGYIFSCNMIEIHT